MPTLKQVRQLLKIHTDTAVHDQLERCATVREMDLVLRTAKVLEPGEPPPPRPAVPPGYYKDVHGALHPVNGNVHTAPHGECRVEPQRPSAPTAADLPPGTAAANLVLHKAGLNKIGVIKAIRGCTNLGLKESKDVTDRIDAVGPQVVLHNVDVATASRMAAEFWNLGATVTLTVP